MTETGTLSRVLVVDDEECVRALCQKALSTKDRRVETAGDREAGWALFQAQPFDMVITDLRMREAQDGFKLLEAVKDRSPATDVVVMTGYPSIDTAIPAIKKGAYDYLIKPFDTQHLRTVVDRCLENRRAAEKPHLEKALREELEAAYTQLADMERSRETFLSLLNHELRTPLTPALMTVELLGAQFPDGKGRALCDLLKSRLDKLKDVIENLLLSADLRQPDFSAARAPVDLREVIRQTVQRWATAGWDKNITIECAIETPVRPLWLDRALMETAFKHLFLNAVQFNRPGGRVLVRAWEDARHVCVSFSDTGIGIPSDQISRAFDSFYQVAAYLTREVGGLGLGLALVKRIVELHEGTITVQSRPGEGSVFTLALPTSGINGGSPAAPARAWPQAA